MVVVYVCVFLATTQSQVNTSAVAAANMCSAVSMPLIFGDERDSVIAKWNQLQAFWGTGRGHYNSQGHFVDFTPDNPFSFFKVFLLRFSVAWLKANLFMILHYNTRLGPAYSGCALWTRNMHTVQYTQLKYAVPRQVL